MGTQFRAEEMRVTLFSILMLASAMAGKKYLIETGKGEGMSCKFEGKVYKDGERMPCGDGCNIRYCINGKPSGCTKVGCVRFEGKSCNDNGTIHKHWESWGECGEYKCLDGEIKHFEVDCGSEPMQDYQDDEDNQSVHKTVEGAWSDWSEWGSCDSVTG